MLVRSCLAVALLTLGCGGADDQTTFEPPAAIAGTGGIVVSGGGGGAAAGMATVEQGGAGSPTAGAGDTGSSAGMGGASNTTGGRAGAAQAGGGSGGASVGGMPAGGAGASQGGQTGAGGQAGDPLEPKPVPGCPGYVKVFVPHGTCAWFHGTFTHQNEACNVINPPPDTCSTASAVSADTTTIVSASAEIARFDFDQTGCPKTCQ